MSLKLLKFAALFLVVPAVFFWLQPAQASINDNVRGLAWNNQYGYISFNCLDDDFTGHFTLTFATHFYNPPCTFSSHGVDLNNDDTLSGEAWNPDLGYLTFTSSSTPPDNRAFINNCTNPTACLNNNTCLACYNESDQHIYGWMKSESNGSWVNLESPDTQPPVTIAGSSAPTPGDFAGYASSSFGAISFNCLDTGTCGTMQYNYHVYLGLLQIRQMSAPNWNFTQACNTRDAKSAIFDWTRRGGTQTAYQLIISTANSTSTGVVKDTGEVLSSASQYICSASNGCNLNYGTSYFWWLRLWDINGSSTPWRQFNTSSGIGDILTDNNVANTLTSSQPTLTFTTYKHEFPTPYFNWNPLVVLVSSSTYFTSNSSYFTTAYPNSNLQSCAPGKCTYLWTTSDNSYNGAVIDNPYNVTTTIEFAHATGTTATLNVTDQDNYMCSTSTTFNVNYAVPIWKEIKSQ
jgi:hypothetical protein